MENLNLADLKLSQEDSRDIIELLARMRNIKNYKRKSNDKLLQAKKENKNNKQQSKNKERIDNKREHLKNLSYKLSKSELLKIRENLYNIEKTKQFNYKKSNKRLDELEKNLLELEKYHDYDDYEYRGIKNIKDLFKVSINKDYYEPILFKSGYNGNYVQYESKGDRILTLKEYLALIEQYLRELLNDYKNKGEWKVQLIAEICSISLKPGSYETHIMHTRSDNEEFMNGSDTDEIIKGPFESFLQKYEENLQEKMKGSNFEFDGVNFLYYDFNKISINRGGSYIDSPKWLKGKKSTINPINNDDKCFQYAVTLALNLYKIRKNPQRMSKIKPFIDQYNRKDIDFRATSKDWKKFELNNEIALNILYVPHNTRKIHVAYKSKHNLTRENQIILLMTIDGEKWHYATVKNLSVKNLSVKNYKVRDHCHYTGKYRGAAHNICNLRYKISKEIPVVFHNESTYDYHFIIKEL